MLEHYHDIDDYDQTEIDYDIQFETPFGFEIEFDIGTWKSDKSIGDWEKKIEYIGDYDETVTNSDYVYDTIGDVVADYVYNNYELDDGRYRITGTVAFTLHVNEVWDGEPEAYMSSELIEIEDEITYANVKDVNIERI